MILVISVVFGFYLLVTFIVFVREGVGSFLTWAYVLYSIIPCVR